MNRTKREFVRNAAFAAGALAAIVGAADAQPFTSEVFESLGEFADYTHIQAADMNGDGIEDFLVASTSLPTSTNGLRWYESDGAPDPTFTRTMIDAGLWTDAFVVDLDGDGDQDVITCGRSIGSRLTPQWFENDGMNPPSFTQNALPDLAVFLMNTVFLNDIHAADADNDGDVDIVLTSEDFSTVYLLRSNGAPDPSFSVQIVDDAMPLTDFGNSGVKGGSVRIADMNGDGNPDIVCGGSNTVRLYSGNGNPGALAFTQSTLGTASGRVEIETADVNGDGDMDVVFCTTNQDRNAGSVGYFTNDGGLAPTFTRVILANDGSYEDVEVADINLRGALDIVATRGRSGSSPVGNETRWYENDGASDPAFTKRTVFGETGLRTVSALGIMDIDRDGDLDIINGARRTSGGNTYQILFHLNDLDPTTPDVFVQPESLYVELPGDAMFSIRAAAAASYQWSRNGVDLPDGANISGATTDTLLLTGLTPEDAGEYRCTAFNAEGATMSDIAVLGVSAPSCASDLSADGVTNADDLAALLAGWGDCP